MVAVVQSAQAGAGGGSWTATLGAGTTATNTLFYAVTGFHGSGIQPSSSAPTLGGSSVSGAAKIASAVNSATNCLLTDAWMLPDIPGSQTACAATVTNSSSLSAVGLAAFEVSGLGAAPAVDQAYPTPSPPTTGNSGSTASPNSAVNSGTTGAIGFAPEFVFGAAAADQSMASGASGFTSLETGSGNNSWSGYQIPASSGGTYVWAQTAASNANWSAVVVTVYSGSTNVTGSFGLAMAPMALAFTGRETMSGSFGLKMAPMALAFTGHETGVNVTGTFGLAMAPMAMRFNARRPPAARAAGSDEARGFKRWLLWGL